MAEFKIPISRFDTNLLPPEARQVGTELLAVLDKVPPVAVHDRELVDAWAAAIGMTGWYAWIPYKP